LPSHCLCKIHILLRPTGEARITDGYNLFASYIIHTVGPVYRGKPRDSQLLTQCYLNSLKLANEYSIKSIAFPAISCGVYGYPIKDACQIAVDITCEFLNKRRLINKVTFILFSLENIKVYENYLAKV